MSYRFVTNRPTPFVKVLTASNGSTLTPTYSIDGHFNGWSIEGTIPPVEEIKGLIEAHKKEIGYEG